MNINPFSSISAGGVNIPVSVSSRQEQTQALVNDAVQLGNTSAAPQGIDLRTAAAALFKEVPKGEKDWTKDIPRDVREPLALSPDGNQVYLRDDRSISCINEHSHTSWSHPLESSKAAGPVTGPEGNVYVADEKKLQTYYPDGRPRWSHNFEHVRFTPPNLITCPLMKYPDIEDHLNQPSPVVGKDGTVYVNSFDHNLCVLDPDTGKVKWQKRLDVESIVPPAVGSDGSVAVIDRNCKVSRFDKDGNFLWSKNIPGSGGDTMLMGSDGTLYINSVDGPITALKPDGSVKWTREVHRGDYRHQHLEGPDGTIYFPIKAKDGTNAIFAVNPDGTDKWNFPLGENNSAHISVGKDGILYATDNKKNIFAIKPDGTPLWQDTAQNSITTPPATTGGEVFYARGDKKLCALRHHKGALEANQQREETLKSLENNTPPPQPTVERNDNEVDIDGAKLQRRKKKI